MGSAWGVEGLPVVGVVVGQVACQRACPASRAAAADLRWPPVRPWTYAPYCSLLPPLTHFAHCLALATNLLTISPFSLLYPLPLILERILILSRGEIDCGTTWSKATNQRSNTAAQE